MTGSPTAYCTKKKTPYFAERRSKIRFFTHKQERKKERKKD
jgi:hypothetical protein